jgi:sporulation related protein
LFYMAGIPKGSVKGVVLMKFKCLIYLLVIFVLNISMAFSQDQILFSDTFTGRDGTRPQKWSIVDAPQDGFWYLHEGQFATGNGDDLVSGNGYSYAFVNIPGANSWTDYSVQTSFWISQTNGKVALIARWQDKDNHYQGLLETYQEKRILRIVKVFKGVQTTLARVQGGVDGVVIPPMENGTSKNDARIMKFTVSGSKLILSFQGVAPIEAEDRTFHSGTAGFGEWFHFVYFDDFLVQKGAAGAVFASTSQILTEVIPISNESAITSTPGTVFRILVADKLPEQTANSFKNQLIGWGYTPVELSQKSDGYEVLLGAFYSENEAGTAKQFLEEEGLNPRKIITVTGAKAVKVKKSAAETIQKKIFRVMAGEFSDLATANGMQTALEGDGYFPIEVVNVSGMQRVYIGSFESGNEADKLASVLRDDGYAQAKMVSVDAGSTSLIVPFEKTVDEKKDFVTDFIERGASESQKDVWGGLNPTEQKEITEIAFGSTDPYANSIIDIQKKLKALDDKQKDIVLSIRDKALQARDRKIQIASLFAQCNRARDRKEWDKALSFIEKVRSIDSNNPGIELKERIIKAAIDKDIDVVQSSEDIVKTLRKAEKLESEDKIMEALPQWQYLLSITKMGSLDRQKAETAIGRINGLVKEEEKRKKKQEEKWQYMIYGAFGLMVVLFIVVLSMAMKRRKHDQELLRRVQELTLKPRLELMEGGGPASIEDLTGGVQPAAAAAMSAAAPEAPPPVQAEPPPPAPEPVVPEPIVPEVPVVPPLDPAPEPVVKKAPITPPPPPPFEEVTLVEVEPDIPVHAMDEISLEPELELEPVAAQNSDDQEHVLMDDLTSLDDLVIDTSEPDPLEDIIIEPGTDIEDILAETPVSLDEISEDLEAPEPEPVIIPELAAKPESVAKPEELPVETVAEKRSLDSDETKTDIQYSSDIAPVDEVKPVKVVEEKKFSPEPVKETVTSVPVEEKASVEKKAPSGVLKASSDGIIFEQNFENDAVGDQPSNWKGDYNYASLKVNDEFPSPNSKKCIVFDKQKGAGSAFYSCHFPDTQGEIGIEFDFRCDKKNKYLLGFYIEKDEDYRYSVHTIVQYIDSGKKNTKPSLRIQGKPTPYNWGDWCQMKYIVNLDKSTVDGYINGKLLSDGERLASCPSSLNTISIRDNLATVGKLMIANIRIYKV